MAPDLRRPLEKFRQAKMRLREDRDAGAGAPCCAEERLGLPFKPGDRAIDLTTGEEVGIISGTRRHVLIPAPKVEKR